MRLSWRPAAMRRVAKAEQCFARSRLRSLSASRLLDRRTRPSWWPHKLSSDSPQLWWSLGEKLGQHNGVAQCFARAGLSKMHHDGMPDCPFLLSRVRIVMSEAWSYFEK